MKAIGYLLVWIAVASIAGACSDEKDDPTPDAGIDAGDTDTGSDSESESESESDTGETEIPPELPEDCTAAQINLPASGDEDGRWPGLATTGAATMMSWAYDAEETTPQWQIQLATYDPGPDGGVGTPATPMTPTVVSKAPTMVARGSEFGVAWLDSRWDGSCTAEEQDDCDLELAFMTFDASGAPANATPKQVTLDSNVEDRPALAATSTGYLVVWTEKSSSSVADVFAVALDADGDPGSVEQISGDDTAAAGREPAIAVLDDVAVVVWLADNQNEVVTRAIGADAAPLGAAQLIDEDMLANNPKVAAGDDGFLVTWARHVYEDFEIYSRMLDSSGAPTGAAQRVTYTTEDVMEAVPAWNGSEFAVLWLSSLANGAEDCVFDSCTDQVFATALDGDGAPRSVPVRLSDDPNTCDVPALAWDGSGWTGAWELVRNLRMQVYFGRMICD